MPRKKDDTFNKAVFPKLTKNDMDMIARALSYCLSDQYGEDITFRFVPKGEAELKAQ